MLAGGKWLPLLPPEHPGLAEVKWCLNRFKPFLVVDPHMDLDPGSRDIEEVTIEVGVRLKQLTLKGSGFVWCKWLARVKLKVVVFMLALALALCWRFLGG